MQVAQRIPAGILGNADGLVGVGDHTFIMKPFHLAG